MRLKIIKGDWFLHHSEDDPHFRSRDCEEEEEEEEEEEDQSDFLWECVEILAVLPGEEKVNRWAHLEVQQVSESMWRQVQFCFHTASQQTSNIQLECPDQQLQDTNQSAINLNVSIKIFI